MEKGNSKQSTRGSRARKYESPKLLSEGSLSKVVRTEEGGSDDGFGVGPVSS